jgi:hypothetical protein
MFHQQHENHTQAEVVAADLSAAETAAEKAYAMALVLELLKRHQQQLKHQHRHHPQPSQERAAAVSGVEMSDDGGDCVYTGDLNARFEFL